MVVKCGTGGVDVDAVCADVAALRARGEPVVIVHGGADDIDALAERLGVPRRKLVAPDGVESRYTDEATLEVVVLALAGRAKPRIALALARYGVDAIGLTGLDARLLGATRKRAHRAIVDGRTVLVRDDHGGKLTSVNARLLSTLVGAGLVPVVSPPAIDEEHRPVNVDADRAAAAIAAALSADHLVLLTAAPGVLADADDETTRIDDLAVDPDGRGKDGGPAVHGGMALKLVAAREALAAGVPRVTIADGRRAEPIARAIAGDGTRVSLAPRAVKEGAA